MIILGSILLIVLIVIAIRCNRVVGKASSTVDLITQYVTLPFTYLAGLLSRDDTEEKPRTRTRTRKTS